MRNIPKQGEIYRHFKGGTYKILTVAEHTENGERLVIYEALKKPGAVYARPLEMFLSEVDREKYPDVNEKYRFVLLEENDEAAIESAADRGLNPMLTKFLDAETVKEKLDIFLLMRGKVNADVLDYAALSLDFTVKEEDIDEKYDSILTKLKALEKYECTRLREKNDEQI